MTVALGVTWALDGLEVTLAGTFAGALQQSPRLALDAAEVGAAASAYLVGAVLGAILLGYLADRFGRRRLYSLTLCVYLLGAVASASSWSFAGFAIGRFVTGVGIGGEYAAINSAIQEFTPPGLRGRVDLIVNGSFWIGAMASAAAAVLLQTPYLLASDLGWRIAFTGGAVLGLGALYLRRHVPESPRWLVTHGRWREAEAVIRAIEAEAGRDRIGLPPQRWPTVALREIASVTPWSVVRALATAYRSRALLGLALMTAQAFCYNAIFFSYAPMLTRFYGVAPEVVGWYVFPFALGNFAGPLLLGPLFDTVGRKPMIGATYAAAGLLLIGIGILFRLGALDAATQVAAWSLTFFLASAGASAAYLTVGELFPLQIRALVIALFYAFGTLLGGVAGPALFGAIIAVGSRDGILLGYFLGGSLMVGAALVEAALGIAAEHKSLEALTIPLASPGPALRR